MSHLFICQMVKGQLQKVYKNLAGFLLFLFSLGVVASGAVLFLPAERWTITGLSLHRLLFCFSGTLFHKPDCVLIIQSCDSSPVVLERLKKILLANVRAMAISEF